MSNTSKSIKQYEREAKSLKAEMGKIKSKIAACDVVQGISSACACVSGMFAGVNALIAAGASDAGSIGPVVERAAADAQFHESLAIAVPAFLVAGGFMLASWIAGEIKDREKIIFGETKQEYKEAKFGAECAREMQDYLNKEPVDAFADMLRQIGAQEASASNDDEVNQ